MPHVSKKQLDEKTLGELDRYLFTLMRNTGSKTRTDIMQELLTPTEKLMIAKRIGVLYLLRQGQSPYQVHAVLGVSPSTVERFQNALHKGAYKRTLSWVHTQSPEGKLEGVLKTLVSLVMTGRPRSLKKIVEEM